MLKVENLRKSFGGVLATDNVSIEFPRESLTAVIGPNGAGKTTFVNQLSGVIRPDRGRILFAGQDITTLRTLIRSGDYGPLDYLVSRFTCENRTYGTWGAFRYEIADPLMVEGAVHHLDLLADMAGGRCATLYAQTWQPPWGQFRGDAQALVTLQTEAGARVLYEGAKTNAVGLNGWGAEYIRAECERATLILSHGRIERFDYDPARRQPDRAEGTGVPVPLLEQPKWANTWLIEQFVRWLDGGPAMETEVEANLQSMALVFAAIESSRTGQPVDVQAFLNAARAQA